MTIYPLVC